MGYSIGSIFKIDGDYYILVKIPHFGITFINLIDGVGYENLFTPANIDSRTSISTHDLIKIIGDSQCNFISKSLKELTKPKSKNENDRSDVSLLEDFNHYIENHISDSPYTLSTSSNGIVILETSSSHIRDYLHLVVGCNINPGTVHSFSYRFSISRQLIENILTGHYE